MRLSSLVLGALSTLYKLVPGEGLMLLARADLTQDHGWLLHLLTFNLNQGVTDDKVSGGSRSLFKREASAFILMCLCLFTVHHRIKEGYVGISEKLWELRRYSHEWIWSTLDVTKHEQCSVRTIGTNITKGKWEGLYSMRRWSENKSDNH